MAVCRRCTECRKTFTPAPSAHTTQRVCGEVCRANRDRRLARARRRRDVDDARVDERERQRASRRQRKEAGCHAPASTRKCPLTRIEVKQFVDRALDRSRATLVRDLRGILLRFAPIAGETEPVRTAMSRVSLGAKDAEKTADSEEILVEPSRVSLGKRGPA